jgi:hypothetical protein
MLQETQGMLYPEEEGWMMYTLATSIQRVDSIG